MNTNETEIDEIPASDAVSAASSTPSFDYLEIPDGAIACYFVAGQNYLAFSESPSLDLLKQADIVRGYFLQSRIAGQIVWTGASQNSGNIPGRIIDGMDVRVGPYNFDLYYFGVLASKSTLSGIIGNGICEEDIEYSVIVEMRTTAQSSDSYWPYAYFGVKTTKGDYFLKDDYHVNNDFSITHAWVSLTPKELSKELKPRVITYNDLVN